MNIRVGLIGVGVHAREAIIPSLLGVESIEVVAICDRADEAIGWANKWFPNAHVTRSLDDESFWDQIECVVACATPQVHELVLEQAIARNKHCFCEKPAGASSAALKALAAKRAIMRVPHPVIRIGHNFRYTAGGSRFIDLLGSGPRRLALLNLTYLGAGPTGGRWGMPSRQAFALTHLTHALDLVVAASGEVAMIGRIDWAEGDGRESIGFSLRTKRCGLVNVTATNAAAAFTCSALAVLEDGATVQLDSLRSVTVTGPLGQEKRSGPAWRERDLGTLYQNDGYGDELKAFFAEVLGASTCRLPDLATAASAMALVEELVYADVRIDDGLARVTG